MKALVPILLFLVACMPSGSASPQPDATVRPGVEVFLANVPQSLRGKRVAFITNASAIDRAKVSDIDLVAQNKDLKLVALLAPEHGIRGDAMDGVQINDEVDPKTGVPVYSLYLAEDRWVVRGGCRRAWRGAAGEQNSEAERAEIK